MPASPQAPESAGIRLTQAHCKDLQCPPERAFVRLWDLHGLRLYLQAGRKRKSWYVAGWRKGKPQCIRLGVWPSMSLERAREQAQRYWEQLPEADRPRAKASVARLRSRVKPAQAPEKRVRQELPGSVQPLSPVSVMPKAQSAEYTEDSAVPYILLWGNPGGQEDLQKPMGIQSAPPASSGKPGAAQSAQARNLFRKDTGKPKPQTLAPGQGKAPVSKTLMPGSMRETDGAQLSLLDSPPPVSIVQRGKSVVREYLQLSDGNCWSLSLDESRQLLMGQLRMEDLKAHCAIPLRKGKFLYATQAYLRGLGPAFPGLDPLVEGHRCAAHYGSVSESCRHPQGKRVILNWMRIGCRMRTQYTRLHPTKHLDYDLKREEKFRADTKVALWTPEDRSFAVELCALGWKTYVSDVENLPWVRWHRVHGTKPLSRQELFKNPLMDIWGREAGAQDGWGCQASQEVLRELGLEGRFQSAEEVCREALQEHLKEFPDDWPEDLPRTARGMQLKTARELAEGEGLPFVMPALHDLWQQARESAAPCTAP